MVTGWVIWIAVAVGVSPLCRRREEEEEGRAGEGGRRLRRRGEGREEVRRGQGAGRADAKAPATTDRDTIGFTQENVAAQMTELEERMFRLSEALASLEPENASRLRLALKFCARS